MYILYYALLVFLFSCLLIHNNNNSNNKCYTVSKAHREPFICWKQFPAIELIKHLDFICFSSFILFALVLFFSFYLPPNTQPLIGLNHMQQWRELWINACPQYLYSFLACLLSSTVCWWVVGSCICMMTCHYYYCVGFSIFSSAKIAHTLTTNNIKLLLMCFGLVWWGSM